MKCKYCNKEVDPDYHVIYETGMIKAELCFDCYYWINHLKSNNPEAFIDETFTHYIIGQETNASDSCKGFAGRKFTIQFDNQIITTTNLWHQGPIPEHLRYLFKDYKKGIFKE